MADVSVRFALETEEPDKDVLEYAKEKINEDPSTRQQILAEFKDLIFEKRECIPHRTDDGFLLRFLRTRDFIVPRAHRLLVNYYDFKKKNTEFYSNVHLNCLQTVAKYNILSIQPFKDDKGRRVLIYRLGSWNPSELSFQELMQATLCVLELGSLEPKTQIIGGVCIFDVGGLHMGHLTNLTTKFISQMLDIVSRTYPLRILAVHIINESYIFNMGFSVLKPFLSKDMKERLFCHGGDKASLHNYINPQYLPISYGGIHPDYGTAEWLDHIKTSENALNEMRDVGYIVF